MGHSYYYYNLPEDIEGPIDQGTSHADKLYFRQFVAGWENLEKPSVMTRILAAAKGGGQLDQTDRGAGRYASVELEVSTESLHP